MTGRLEIKIYLLITVMIFTACSKDSNPAVPGAPEEDVITLVEMNPPIKVGLVSFTPQKHLYVSITQGSFSCFVGDSLQTFADGISGDIHKFTGTEETIEYTAAGSDSARELNNKVIRIEPSDTAEGGYLMIGPSKSSIRPYRGNLRLILEGKNILAVNELPLEDYLPGVVPAEMDAAWPEEALLTQAIVSRTFAIFNLGGNANRGYDIADDERGQKYGGMAVETDATTDAVIETTNMVVTYEDNLAIVVFHSESGGETASNLDVWPHSGEIPYLSGVSDVMGIMDFSSGASYDSWSNWASFEQLRIALNQDGETFLGDYFSSISVLGVSENGRVQSIDILGEKNPVVPALTFGYVLNRKLEENFLPSNQFTITLEGDGYRFTGSGEGHGAGMSQWGVYQRAKNNQGYEFIIQHYFPGCEIFEISIDGIVVVHNQLVDTIR